MTTTDDQTPLTRGAPTTTWHDNCTHVVQGPLFDPATRKVDAVDWDRYQREMAVVGQCVGAGYPTGGNRA